MTSGDEGGGWPDGVGLSRSERDLPPLPFRRVVRRVSPCGRCVNQAD
jgi:hypothetical protein